MATKSHIRLSDSPTGLSPARLDWVCIGAQKAGTSTLRELLRTHPQIVMPSDTTSLAPNPSGRHEDAFFNRDVTARDVADYLHSRFGKAPVDAKRGKVSPAYMGAPEIADRLHAYMPDARVIAILRDPVQRAASHYRMNVRRGVEGRTFENAVGVEIEMLSVGERPDPSDGRGTYVWRGCYATILGRWLERFGPESLLVLFTSELKSRQSEVLAQAQDFIGVDRIPPVGEDLRAHSAPPSHRLSRFRRPAVRSLRRLGVLDRIPPERRNQMTQSIDGLLARLLPAHQQLISADVQTELRAFYADENARLSSLVGCPLPWT